MSQPLNSPLEVGVRILIILTAAYPYGLDMNRLVLYDYAVLHSRDLGGPESIHPAIPGRSGEMGLKRSLIDQGLRILARGGLVDITADGSGIMYVASEDAQPFLAHMHSGYSRRLEERANWAVNELADQDNEVIRARLGKIFTLWAEEFDSQLGDML